MLMVEQLKQQIEQYKKDRETHLQLFHQMTGALFVLEKQLEEMTHLIDESKRKAEEQENQQQSS